MFMINCREGQHGTVDRATTLHPGGDTGCPGTYHCCFHHRHHPDVQEEGCEVSKANTYVILLSPQYYITMYISLIIIYITFIVYIIMSIILIF